MALVVWRTGAWRLRIVKRSDAAGFEVLPKRFCFSLAPLVRSSSRLAPFASQVRSCVSAFITTDESGSRAIADQCVILDGKRQVGAHGCNDVATRRRAFLGRRGQKRLRRLGVPHRSGPHSERFFGREKF